MITKTVYQTDHHGFFVGPADAIESPREPGAWVVPGGCVEVPPPALAEGERAQWDGDAWVVVPPAPEAAPEPAPPVDLADYLAWRRWRAEIGGTAWNGWTLATDDRSQGKYMAEVQAISLGVRLDPSPWKFPHGFELQISNDQVREMAIAARDHVLSCFALEAQLAAGIADGTITTTDQIDSAFAALEPQGA